ncbi:MAG TPA: LysM peptidoglycan-binding domain-containing protein, partial [Atopostipes sp.]|nr:LysM peptidoglycan-binding domain-containing protein [Atopostipes sp.]
VKAGDTLSGIARRFNVTVNDLVSWNKLNSSHLIFVNQKLAIKNSEQTQTIKQSTPTRNRTYQIARGDTLSGIAVRFNTTVNALKAKNNLKSDLIFVGQTLKI